MKKERNVFVFCSWPPYVKKTRLCNVMAGDVFYVEEPDGSFNSDFGEFLSLALSDAVGVDDNVHVKFQPITSDIC